MKIFGIKTRINQNGRIVLPALIRQAMGLRLGDSIVMSLEDGILRIEPHRASYRTRASTIQDEFKETVKPGTPASSDLMQERREEPQVEKEEWIG